MNEPRPASKIWLETDEGYVFGPGVYNLLKAIKDKGTLKEASQSLDMSYRFAWGLIKKAEDKLGVSLIEASKGGRQGGGSSRITDLGEHFITDFEKIQKAWRDFREQYEKSTLIKAKIILIEGEPALRIDEPIYFENISSLPPGEEVELRILLT